MECVLTAFAVMWHMSDPWFGHAMPHGTWHSSECRAWLVEVRTHACMHVWRAPAWLYSQLACVRTSPTVWQAMAHVAMAGTHAWQAGSVTILLPSGSSCASQEREGGREGG